MVEKFWQLNDTSAQFSVSPIVQCTHESSDNFYFKYIFECLDVHYFWLLLNLIYSDTDNVL
jgi:hypothetical protein